MKRAALALVLTLSAACSRPDADPKPAQPQLLNVALAEVARLEASVPPLPDAPPADEEKRGLVREALSVMSDAGGRFRGVALEDMARAGGGAVPILDSILRDASEDVAMRVASAEALSAIGTPPAVEALVRALESAPEPWLRAQAAWRLRNAKHDFFLPRMMLRLKYEVDEPTVVFLADALASMGSLAGLDALRTVLASGRDEEARNQAAAVAAEIVQAREAADLEALWTKWSRGELSATEPEPSGRLRLEAARRIVLLAEWDLRKVDDARFVLVHLGSFVVEPLARALRDENLYVRVHSAQCLERMGLRAAAAAGALVESLRDPHLAHAAVTALAAIGARGERMRIESLLEDRRAGMDLRTACARALGRLADPAAAPVLQRVFDADEPHDLDQAIARALVELRRGDPVVPFLVDCLTSPLADAGGAETALETWLVQRAEDDPRAAETLTRWRELAPPAGTIETSSQADGRRASRAELLRALDAPVR